MILILSAAFGATSGGTEKDGVIYRLFFFLEETGWYVTHLVDRWRWRSWSAEVGSVLWYVNIYLGLSGFMRATKMLRF